YKNVDLLKMHAYKDAIRRSGGAYVLYPGTEPDCKRGFHEIIPGLGAFAINPTTHETGIAKLSEFIDQVTEHLLDRASQRENVSSERRQRHRQSTNAGSHPHGPAPGYISGRPRMPDETF